MNMRIKYVMGRRCGRMVGWLDIICLTGCFSGDSSRRSMWNSGARRGEASAFTWACPARDTSRVGHTPKSPTGWQRYYHGSHGAEGEATPTAGPSAVLSQRPLDTESSHLQMISFYHFETVPDPWSSRNDLFTSIRTIPGLRGTIYIAEEGINAQMAVPPGDAVDQLLRACTTSLPFDPFRENPPNLGDVVPIRTPTFDRLVVRVRDFILRDGISSCNGTAAILDWQEAGLELSPPDWHAALSSPEVGDRPLLLDCRNLYESDLGTFKSALPLETNTFQETWPTLVEMTENVPKDTPIHIFCTGGIRCVKVGAYLKQRLGFHDVKRLQHGIIGYQQWIQEQESARDAEIVSLWKGENFLFDKRRFSEKETGDEDDTIQ